MEYPYTRTEMFGYVTAPMATLYVCQVSYVFLAALTTLPGPLSGMFSESDFYRDRDEARLRFGSLSFRFREEVLNVNGTIADAVVQTLHHIQGATHASVQFRIGRGIHIRSHLVRVPAGRD